MFRFCCSPQSKAKSTAPPVVLSTYVLKTTRNFLNPEIESYSACVKIFINITAFKILRLTFHRKSIESQLQNTESGRSARLI